MFRRPYLSSFFASPAVFSLTRPAIVRFPLPAPTLLISLVMLVLAGSSTGFAASDSPDFIESIQRLVEHDIDKLGPSGGMWGVYAVDLSTGKPIVDLHGETLFLPASNRKLFTTSLALRRLGIDYQFTTRLWAAGDVKEDGTLDGDLVLEASGDPTLRPTFLNAGSGLSLLSQWARAVESAGIKRIDGHVVVDCSVYREPSFMPPGWGWDQLTELYGALPSALAINENRVLLKISPGGSVGAPCTVETLPTLKSGLDLKNTTRTGSASDKNTLKVVRGTGPAALLLIGTLPRDVAPVSLTVPVPDPVSAWSESFGRALERAGVTFKGPVVVSSRRVAPDSPSPKAKLLAEHQSPPLARIVQHTNKESDNQCAEMLYLAAGAEAFGQASYEASHLAESSFLRKLGVDTSLVEGEDGCGLGRTDLVAPKAVVQLLSALAEGPDSKALFESLPVSGKDGTLSYRMSKGALRGQVSAKTGTLDNVSALSGYIRRADGRRIVFSILVNNFTRSVASMRRVQDGVCEILYRANLP